MAGIEQDTHQELEDPFYETHRAKKNRSRTKTHEQRIRNTINNMEEDMQAVQATGKLSVSWLMA